MCEDAPCGVTHIPGKVLRRVRFRAAPKAPCGCTHLASPPHHIQALCGWDFADPASGGPLKHGFSRQELVCVKMCAKGLGAGLGDRGAAMPRGAGGPWELSAPR